MAYTFEWDAEKDAANLRKHGVTFREAASAFGDPLAITIPDIRHSEEENRYALLANSERGRLLAVMHTERGESIRIISARPATPRERRAYEEGDL